MQNIASFPVMTFFVSAHSWFYCSLTTILMLLKLPQLSPIAKKQPLEKNFIPWNMEPTWLRAAQMQMPGYIHNFSPKLLSWVHNFTASLVKYLVCTFSSLMHLNKQFQQHRWIKCWTDANDFYLIPVLTTSLCSHLRSFLIYLQTTWGCP